MANQIYYRCPEDGARIPHISTVGSGQDVVEFAWCAYCHELFAFRGFPPRFVAAYAKDLQGGWRELHSNGSETQMHIAQIAARTVSPSIIP
jgi:hypothetical protein